MITALIIILLIITSVTVYSANFCSTVCDKKADNREQLNFIRRYRDK